MKFKELRETYYSFSNTASTVSRQASFAGIALIWVFKSQYDKSLVLPDELLWPTLLLTMSLTFDLLHYAVCTAIWGVFNRHNEIKYGLSYDGDIAASKYFNWPGLFFFWGKLLLVIIGYFIIFSYVFSNIKFVD